MSRFRDAYIAVKVPTMICQGEKRATCGGLVIHRSGAKTFIRGPSALFIFLNQNNRGGISRPYTSRHTQNTKTKNTWRFGVRTFPKIPIAMVRLDNQPVSASKMDSGDQRCDQSFKWMIRPRTTAESWTLCGTRMYSVAGGVRERVVPRLLWHAFVQVSSPSM